LLDQAAAVKPSDEVLAALLIQDDQSAFEELVRRYHRRVHGICYRMTGSVQEAEDLSQETFLRVFRYRSSYQSGRAFRLWLDRICVNVCVSHKDQMRQRGSVVSLGSGSADLPAEAGAGGGERQDPEARAGMSELVQSVQKIAVTLPLPYRAALVLRAFAGLSYQEIADVLRCSVGTVMSRLRRARINVRNHLRDRP